MSVKKWEKYKAAGTVVRIANRGEHNIEILTSTFKQGLQKELLAIVKGIEETQYPYLSEQNNIRCLLAPGTSGLGFKELKQEIANLLAPHIIQFEAASVPKTDQAVTTSPATSPPSKKRQQYHNVPPNYKVVAARA